MGIISWKIKNMLFSKGATKEVDKEPINSVVSVVTTSESAVSITPCYPKAILHSESSTGTKWYKFMTSEQMCEYYKEEELKTELTSEIAKNYSGIKDVNISFYNFDGHYPCGRYHIDKKTLSYNEQMCISLTVSWTDNITEIMMYELISRVGKKHFDAIPNYENEHWQNTKTMYARTQANRKYSDDVILSFARKYADCISKDLVINIETVKALMVGGVTIYNLVLVELENIDLSKSKEELDAQNETEPACVL